MSSCQPNNTIILCPCYKHLEPETEQGLLELKSKGWTSEVKYGISTIDGARSTLASWALHSGYEYLFWIDSDIGFSKRDFLTIAQSPDRFTCAPYMQKTKQGGIAVLPLQADGNSIDPSTRGIHQIRAAGFGFMKTHKSIFEAMMRGSMSNVESCIAPVPACQNAPNEPPFWPFFQPQIFDMGDGRKRYYGEDYSFCLQAEKLGFKLYANFDTDLMHIGRYGYRWRQDAAAKIVTGQVKLGKRDDVTKLGA